jgi:hypothetical protein
VLHEFAYHPVYYRIEILVKGEVIAEWRTLQPFAAFAVGDILNLKDAFDAHFPGIKALVDQGKVLRLVQVEHLLMRMSGGLMHDIQLSCEAVPDTDAARRPQVPGY